MFAFLGLKGDENVKLGINSIFGSAKMTQVDYSNPKYTYNLSLFIRGSFAYMCRPECKLRDTTMILTLSVLEYRENI